MAKVKITGHASGSGVVTVTAPNTSTDRTITLPDATATLATKENFLSTGIDDNASAVKLTVSDSGINVNGAVTSLAIKENDAGNVGIGVTPEAWHSAYNGGIVQINSHGAIFSQGAETYLTNNVYEPQSGGMKYINTNVATLYSQQTGIHHFKTAASGSADAAITWTNAMTIENDGSVLVKSFATNGSTTGIKIDTSAGSQTPILSSASSTATRTHMTFVNPNGEVGFIKTTNSATAFATSSDYRLKENVDYTWDATTRLKQLKPARFNFISDDTNTLVDGFIAHEAQAVVPECVVGTKDAMMDEEYEVTPAVMDGETVVTEAVMGTRSVPNMQGIDQSKLVPLLVKTIQELEARITALEA
jgi:hypothetical protein